MTIENGPSQIQPDGWAAPRGYSNGMLAPAGWRILTIAGQVGWDAHQKLVSEDLVEQFAQALRNVRTVLEAAGGRVEYLMRLTFYVVDKEVYRSQRRSIGENYRTILGKHYPAATLIEVSGLLEPGALVEIEATAAIPAEATG